MGAICYHGWQPEFQSNQPKNLSANLVMFYMKVDRNWQTYYFESVDGRRTPDQHCHTNIPHEPKSQVGKKVALNAYI